MEEEGGVGAAAIVVALVRMSASPSAPVSVRPERSETEASSVVSEKGVGGIYILLHIFLYTMLLHLVSVLWLAE